MTSQNCGDKYSSLLSDTASEGASLDGLDQSKSSSQSKRKDKYKSWNFQSRLQTCFLGMHSVSGNFLLMKRKLCRLSNPNQAGSSCTSSCIFCFWTLWFRNGVSSSARWKHFDFDSYRLIRPIREQDSAHDDAMIRGRYMGASPLRIN